MFRLVFLFASPTAALTIFLHGALQANKNGNGNGSSAPPVVGFCFSFAVEQQALNSGKLLGWTKGFNVEGVIGKDVVQLLSGQPKGACATQLLRNQQSAHSLC